LVWFVKKRIWFGLLKNVFGLVCYKTYLAWFVKKRIWFGLLKNVFGLVYLKNWFTWSFLESNRTSTSSSVGACRDTNMIATTLVG